MSENEQKKAIIIDPCFGKQHGHWENYCKRLYSELDRLGFHVSVYGQKDYNPQIIEAINFTPLFSVSPFDNIHAKSDILRISNEVYSELELLDLGAIKENDILIFQSIFPTNFVAILNFLKKQMSVKKTRSFIFFQFPAADQKENISFLKNGLYRIRRYLRGCFTNLRHLEWCENNFTLTYLQSRRLLKVFDCSNISFLANSENMAKNFSIVLNKKVHSIPMPGPDKHEIEALIKNHHPMIASNKRIKIGYFGHASLDKGGHLLEAIVKEALKNNNEIEFHLHLSPNHELELIFNQFKNTVDDRIVFYDGHLEKSTMIKLISEVDIVLLPYSPKKYANCPSAVLMESLILNKVVVVPENSSLSETVQLYDVGFELFKQFNSDAIVFALLKAINNFEFLNQKSTISGEKYYQSNNIRKYTNDFLQLTNDRQVITK